MLIADALHQAKVALGGLIVDAARMRENLGISRGLIVAEAAMIALAPLTGRQQAHDLVYAACRVVNERGGTSRVLLQLVTVELDIVSMAAAMSRRSSFDGAAPSAGGRMVAVGRDHREVPMLGRSRRLASLVKRSSRC